VPAAADWISYTSTINSNYTFSGKVVEYGKRHVLISRCVLYGSVVAAAIARCCVAGEILLAKRQMYFPECR
jgi:hypothetical protein